MSLNCSCSFASHTMDKDQLVAILLTKDEIYTLRSMLHDSMSYWHSHWQKAASDSNYFLSKSGCDSVIKHHRKVEDKIIEIFYAVHPEYVNQEEDVDNDSQSIKEDKVLEVA